MPCLLCTFNKCNTGCYGAYNLLLETVRRAGHLARHARRASAGAAAATQRAHAAERARGPQAALSTVDVLVAFAEFGATANGPTCRAELLPMCRAAGGGPEAQPSLDLQALWHPCARAGAGGAVVPNDLRLGTCAAAPLHVGSLGCMCSAVRLGWRWRQRSGRSM